MKKNIFEKKWSLNFDATLGENNEGSQELPYSATHNKKVHYSALQWYYLSSTMALFKLYSSTIQLYNTLIFLPAVPTFNFKP